MNYKHPTVGAQFWVDDFDKPFIVTRVNYEQSGKLMVVLTGELCVAHVRDTVEFEAARYDVVGPLTIQLTHVSGTWNQGTYRIAEVVIDRPISAVSGEAV